MIPDSFTRDGYVSHMKKMARWAARMFTRQHPMFTQQDLEQEAVIPLLAVYDKEPNKPPIELCRLGRVAVIRHLRSLHRHAFNYGEFTTPVLDLDEPITQDGKPLSDIIGTAGLEDIFFWFALDELERVLGDLEQKVLAELLAPSTQTLRLIRAAYESRPRSKKTGNIRQGNYGEHAKLSSIATTLQVPKAFVKHALWNIQRLTLEVFPSDFSTGPYKVVSQGAVLPSNHLSQGEQGMSGKGVVIDDPLMAGVETPEPVSAAEQQKAAKAKKTKEAPAKGKAATKPKASKTAAPKGNGKAKGKGEKAPKAPKSAKAPRVFDPAKPFRDGSNADTAWKYLAGVLGKGKDKVVTIEDATKAFEKVGKKSEVAAKAGSYFLYWLAKHGLLTRQDRGAYSLPKK